MKIVLTVKDKILDNLRESAITTEQKLWDVSRNFQPIIRRGKDIKETSMYVRISTFWANLHNMLIFRKLKRVDYERWQRIVNHKKHLVTTFIDTANKPKTFIGTLQDFQRQQMIWAAERNRPKFVCFFIRWFGFRYRVVLISAFVLLCLVIGYMQAPGSAMFFNYMLVAPYVFNSFLIAIYEGRGFKPKVLSDEAFMKQEKEWQFRLKFEKAMMELQKRSDEDNDSDDGVGIEKERDTETEAETETDISDLEKGDGDVVEATATVVQEEQDAPVNPMVKENT